jgi:hypothetical protein
MHNYAGNPAVYPTNIGLVDDADLNPATASALDVPLVNLADRTASINAHKLTKDGTDSITGTVHVASGGNFIWDAGSFSQISGEVDVIVAGGIRANAVGAIVPTLAGGIESPVTGGIAATAVGGVESEVPGGFKFNGGATDFGLLSPTRTKSYTYILKPSDPTAIDTTHWASPGCQPTAPPYFTGTASATVPIYLELTNPHQGATLVSVAISLLVVAVHAAVPHVLPALSVQRCQLVPGSPFGVSQTLASGDSGTGIQFSPAPATGAAWHASGGLQQLVYNCNQNNVIDNVNNTYFLVLTDENGAGALAGNAYLAVTATYASISDLRFSS